MKSSFLFTLVAVTLFTSLAWGQTSKTDTAKEEEGKSAFDKFYERVKIGYFGVYSGSSFDHWDRYTLTEGGAKDNEFVPNVWNQFAIQYNFGAMMNFVVAPRFTTFLASTSGHGKGSRQQVVLEDALVGFQGVILQSEDKKFALWSRPGFRLPTSEFSRDNDITTNLEILNAYTYDFDKTWQIGLYQQVRQWVYEQRFTAFRYRIFHSPYISYTINDSNKIQLYYEHYLENRRRLQSQNGKKPVVKDYWQNAMLAWSTDVSEKVNLTPFIGYFLDAQDISNYPIRPMWFGMWISWSVK